MAAKAPIRVVLRHETLYTYDRPVILGPHTIRLRPAAHGRTPVLAYQLTVSPVPALRTQAPDPSGNLLTRVTFAGPTRELRFTVELTAELGEVNPFDFFVEPEAATWPFAYPALMRPELAPYCVREAAQPRLDALAQEFAGPARPSVEMLVALNRLVNARTEYTVRMEPGVQRPDETIALGLGSCRDSAWLLVQLARSLGYAARFASGYLIQLVDPAHPVERLVADSADLHAWAEIYLPGAGWIGLDATSGLITGAGHIPLACNAHPDAAAPLTGTVQADPAGFTVEMSVARLPALPG